MLARASERCVGAANNGGPPRGAGAGPRGPVAYGPRPSLASAAASTLGGVDVDPALSVELAALRVAASRGAGDGRAAPMRR
ncbi:MAG: hypothetical protein R3A52_09020 [Polyangiales bacterium]